MTPHSCHTMTSSHKNKVFNYIHLIWFGAIRMAEQVFLYIFFPLKHAVTVQRLNCTSSRAPFCCFSIARCCKIPQQTACTLKRESGKCCLRLFWGCRPEPKLQQSAGFCFTHTKMDFEGAQLAYQEGKERHKGYSRVLLQPLN